MIVNTTQTTVAIHNPLKPSSELEQFTAVLRPLLTHGLGDDDDDIFNNRNEVLSPLT